MPSAQFYAPWFRDPVRPALPRDAWLGLSEHGQRVSRYSAVDPSDDVSFAPVIGKTPGIF